MWILASSQATSSPSIQIFSDLVRGISSPSDPGGDGVADLVGGAAEGRRVLDGLGDAGGGIGLAQEVQHEGGRADGRHGIGLARADDVGRRTMYRFEQRR